MNIGLQLIKTSIVQKSTDFLELDEYFDNDSVDVFLHVKNFFIKYGELPSLNSLIENYVELRLIDDESPIDYLKDALVASWRNRKYHELGLHIVNTIETTPIDIFPEDLPNHITSSLMKTGKSIDPEAILNDYNESKDYRKEDYLKRKSGEVTAFYKTGYDVFDKAFGGLFPERFYLIMGAVGNYKTTLAFTLILQDIVRSVGAMVISGESGRKSLIQRFDSMFSGVDWDLLQRAELSQKDEEKYFEFLSNKDELNITFPVVNKSNYLTKIKLAIEEGKQKIILIDSFYEFCGRNWEKMGEHASIINDMIQNSESAVLMTTQGNDDERVKYGKSLNEITSVNMKIEKQQDGIANIFSKKSRYTKNDKQFLLVTEPSRGIFELRENNIIPEKAKTFKKTPPKLPNKYR